jgi:alpha-tubulin suppressor-like RCC1 family protein
MGSLCCWGDKTLGGANVAAGDDFVAIAAGGNHCLALKSDGSIVCWGMNMFGQCNVPSPNTGFVAVAAAGAHSLGLKSDGSIVAWGDNRSGESNVPSPNSGFVAIAAGSAYSMGLKSDGSIVAWGDNSIGQCNVPSPNTGFVAISPGYQHCLGLKSNGSIVAWGYTGNGRCNVPSPNTGFVAIAAGYAHSLGLKSDGSILAWGYNGAGACNVPFPNTGFVAIAAYQHSLALKSDGSVVAWGYNYSGQCDVPLPNTRFVAISAGFVHSLAIQTPPPVGGSGTDNYIPRWVGTSDLADSVIYQTDAGNIGIGTTGPASTLEVSDVGGSPLILRHKGVDVGGGAGIDFRYGGTPPAYIARILPYVQMGGGGDLLFQTAADYDGPYETKMILQRGGNVGIGTTSPQALLHIRGAGGPNVHILADSTSGDASIRVKASGSDWRLTTQAGTGKFFLSDVSAGQDRLGIDPNGNMGVGTTSPSERLDVDGTARLRQIAAGSGTTVVADPNGRLMKSSSSRRYKTSIVDLKTDSDAVLNLRPVRFQWKATGQEDIGLIAEEVAESMQDLVIYDAEGKPDAVKYDRVSLYLMQVVKNLKSDNESLKSENESLKQRLDLLEKRMEKLERDGSGVTW